MGIFVYFKISQLGWKYSSNASLSKPPSRKLKTQNFAVKCPEIPEGGLIISLSTSGITIDSRNQSGLTFFFTPQKRGLDGQLGMYV